MVADSLVYHPSVNHYVRFVNTTSKYLLYLPIPLNPYAWFVRVSKWGMDCADCVFFLATISRQGQSPPVRPIPRTVPLILSPQEGIQRESTCAMELN